MSEDDYQREYLSHRGQVLLLDKTRFRGLMVGLGLLSVVMLAGSATFAVAAATAGLGAFFIAAGAMGVGGVITGTAGLLFSVLRVAVTSEELHVQYGLSGPRIPIENILECDVEKYDVWKYGGYGLKIGLIDGRWQRAYSIPTADNRVVRVRWRDGGDEKMMVFSSEQPDAVLAAIQKAMAMRSGGGAFRMRVDAAEEQEVELEEREERRQKRSP